jgi:cardiolipin synthase A/B
MTTRVAIPITYSTVKLHLEKGRRWSVAEHALLFALKSGDSTAADLAARSLLPHRMVLEALINLMRVGWVEVVATGDRVRFAITSGGCAHVDKEELPVVTEPLTKDMKFAVDGVLGGVLRWRELTFMSPARFERLDRADIVVLPATPDLRAPKPRDIVESLLDEDETHRGSDRSAARPGEGWVLATVVGDKVEGLPRDAHALRRRVLEVARQSEGVAVEVPVAAPPAMSPPREVHLAPHDLIVGGQEHWEHIERTIAGARSWIAIHSTFIREEPFRRLLPLLEVAAKSHGVRTDIFWGRGSEREAANPGRRVVERFNADIRAHELMQWIKVHPFSTSSHAKLLIADDGRGRFRATIGSCNWLYTGWNSLEVSVRLGDGAIVADVMDALAEMAYQATGDWSGITAEVAGKARLARADRSRKQGRLVEGRLLFGADHVRMFEMARDDAQRRIVIASHRLGAAAENMALRPTRAAVADRDVDATLYYSTPSDQITARVAAEMTFRANQEGVLLRQVTEPTMHAKFMYWDDDDLVVTSQNLLSADPLSPLEEIGIHLRGPGAPRDLSDRLNSRFAVAPGE